MDTLYIASDLYSSEAWPLLLPGAIMIVFLVTAFIVMKCLEKRATSTMVDVPEGINKDSYVIVDYNKGQFLGEHNDDRFPDFVYDPRFAYKWTCKSHANQVCRALNHSRECDLKVITVIEALAIWQCRKEHIQKKENANEK